MTAHVRGIAGGRLHCQHGPIDLIIGATGPATEIRRAYAAVAEVFPAILPRLVGELSQLRTSLSASAPVPQFAGPVAQRMAAAVWPYRDVFITPMAAVAGAVADEVLQAMTAAAVLDRAYVNNGGDIAIHLASGARMTVGVVADLAVPAIDATIAITWADPVRGIATSGWRGRSQSLGIADAVTVLAGSAADADAAATIIANAVDADDPAICRLPARQIKADSDLGNLLVTVQVGPIAPDVRRAALDRGLKKATTLVLKDQIVAACLSCQGETRIAGIVRQAEIAA